MKIPTIIWGWPLYCTLYNWGYNIIVRNFYFWNSFHNQFSFILAFQINKSNRFCHRLNSLDKLMIQWKLLKFMWQGTCYASEKTLTPSNEIIISFKMSHFSKPLRNFPFLILCRNFLSRFSLKHTGKFL